MIMLEYTDPDFSQKFASILQRADETGSDVEETVKSIIAAVKSGGDQADLELTQKFDRIAAAELAGLEVKQHEIDDAFARAGADELKAIKAAVKRVRAFHERQKQNSWLTTDEPDIILGQKVTPLSRVGIYVPGGKACYPSSVIMNALPAKVAGVGEIIMTVPTPDGQVSPYLLIAASLSGVDRIFRIGGAQAVAAMAYGTETIPRVDKITGPGNIYVATAKKLVFGQVGIDMVAGPSEILIINDGSGDPSHIAADLLSQAEHDELASSILITTNRALAEKVAANIDLQLQSLNRTKIASASWERFGAIIIVPTLQQAIDFSNRIAPEHLELAVDDPFSLLPLITNAGAIFMGHWTPEAAGDYLAGPNHTLPTAGTARFFSPLGVDDFVKKSSIVCFSEAGIKRLGKDIVTFANLEGLDAHGKSVSIRLDS